MNTLASRRYNRSTKAVLAKLNNVTTGPSTRLLTSDDVVTGFPSRHATNPLVTSDTVHGYSIGSLWLNTVTGELWTCTSAAEGAAKWKAGGYGITFGAANTVSVKTATAADTVIPFAGAFDLPSNPPIGTRVVAEAVIEVTNKVATDTIGGYLRIEGASLVGISPYEPTVGHLLRLKADFVITKADEYLATELASSYTGGSTTVTLPSSSAATLNSSPTIAAAVIWGVGADPANAAALISFTVRCISPNVG
jgi:hypothetical protein